MEWLGPKRFPKSSSRQSILRNTKIKFDVILFCKFIYKCFSYGDSVLQNDRVKMPNEQTGLILDAKLLQGLTLYCEANCTMFLLSPPTKQGK